jgi:hypothetical protein
MPFIDAGPMTEEIYLPHHITPAASIIGTSNQLARKESFSYYKVDNPGGEINIPKKRQTRVNWLPNDFNAWEAQRRQGRRSTHLEETSGRKYPTAEEDTDSSDPQSPRSKGISFRLHWSRSIQRPQSGGSYDGYPDSSTNGYSSEKNCQSTLPLRRPSGTVGNTRNVNRRSLYNMADLVNIKYQRENWIQLLIEYGTYVALAAFVYFVLVGVPLWNGAVYWLYWAMQHKLIFSYGWAIAIAPILL